MAKEKKLKQPKLPKLKLNKKVIFKKMRKVETATTKHAHKSIIKRWDNIREVQSKVVMWIVVMGLLIAATGLQLFWQQQNYLTNAAEKNGTYVEAVLGPIDTLNPILAGSSAEKAASYLMFSSLLKYDETGTLNNDLATNIAVNDTKNVYTVSIRNDAKWNDGKKLTADDIVFTIGLIKNPDVRSTITGWSNIAVKALNDTTVEFTLPTSYAEFSHVLTFPVLPKHVLKDVDTINIRENSFSQNPIGSGIFKLRFIQNSADGLNKKIVYMARNDNYYGGAAKLARMQINAYNTTEEILSALSSNKVNAAADLSPVDIKEVDRSRYDISVNSVQSGVYALLNMNSKILNDVNIRSALRLATDTSAIISKLPKETQSIELPFTNGQLTGDVPTVPKYNIDAAKAALDAAGWVLDSNGKRIKDGVQLKLSVVTVKDNEFEALSDIIAKQWAAVGVVVETQIIDPSNSTQNVSILQPRNYDVLLYQLNIGADPDVYVYWHSSQISSQGLNFSNYSNTTSDYALASARDRVDVNLRNAKYLTFAKQWISDVPAIGLYQSTAQYVYRNNVSSVNNDTVLVSSTDRYNQAIDWAVGKTSVFKTP